MSRIFGLSALLALTFAAAAASAADIDVFKDNAAGDKIHVTSGFVCPLKIGRFDRDAVGEKNPVNDTDYCAYSARDGVYGSIALQPLRGDYDPKALMAEDFISQEGMGGKFISESTLGFGSQNALAVYARIYDAAKNEAMRYRMLMACAAVRNWVVRVTVEYATPRDEELKNDFLKAVYDSALSKLGGEADH